MRAINLYTISRKINGELMPLYEKALSDRDEVAKVRKEEIDLIGDLVNNFIFHRVKGYYYEDWFYSFSIPQIGKEFDLLKISAENVIINIELKSQEVTFEKIDKQLIQNRYYLSHIASKIFSFTYMKCNDGIARVYKYENDSLKQTSIDELLHCVKQIVVARKGRIEEWFKPKDYLISPLNTPEKFIEGRYYLNKQQEQIKRSIEVSFKKEKCLWGIRGSAGTGKTLLLYDIAKSLSKNNKVCVIHCGLLNDGHKYINSHLDNVSVIDAKSISLELISCFDIICVDETQRLYKTSLDQIISVFDKKLIKGCIFSYDSAQALSKTEVKRNNPKRLNEIDGFNEEKLTERIRTNKEIFSFIRNMMRLYDKPKKRVEYKNIDILYANNIKESDKIIKFYRRKGYILITYTPSQYVSNSIDHYSEFVNSHQVIGQEFDNVMIVIDNNFRYSSEGDLEAKEHPNPDYLFPRLFYQNISRTREKLCIVVIDNEEMFKNLLKIKNNCLD